MLRPVKPLRYQRTGESMNGQNVILFIFLIIGIIALTLQAIQTLAEDQFNKLRRWWGCLLKKRSESARNWMRSLISMSGVISAKVSWKIRGTSYTENSRGGSSQRMIELVGKRKST